MGIEVVIEDIECDSTYRKRLDVLATAGIGIRQ